MFLGLCVTMTAAFLVWAAVSPLNIVSNAMGEVVPATQVKSVQHLEGGIVAEILVEEGETVREGQPVVELETTRSGAEVEELGLRLVALRSDIARLEAEVAEADAPDFPPDLRRDQPELVRKATELFAVRRSRLDFELETQRNLALQRSREVEEFKARIANNQKTLRLLDEQVAISEQLLQRDLTNRMVHLNLLKDAAFYKVRIETDRDHFSRRDLRYDLFPGMQVVCSIQIGQRTVLEYLIDPLVGMAGRALQER